MSYKEAFVSCCSQDVADSRSRLRQRKLYQVMTPQEARIVDEVAIKLVTDIAAAIGEAIDGLAEHLQVNAALYLLRIATVNAESMEEFFNEEAIAAALMSGARVDSVNGVTPGCACPVCTAIRSQDEFDRQRERPN